MQAKILLFLAGCFAAIRVLAGDEKLTVAAALSAATVYRAGAELNHNATVTLKKGTNEIVLEGVSNGLDINSVQVGSNRALTILSMAFSTDYLVTAAKSALVQRLEDSVKQVVKETERLQVLIKTDLDLLDALKANREIRGTQTGVSVAELIKMMEYYKTKTLELQNEMAVYRDKQTKATDQLQKLNNQISEEEQKNNKTLGKLLLQVVTAAAGSYELSVSYMTPKAFWNPSYELRVETVNKPMILVYKARMSQTTGLDWKQVKLTLSTSMPSQNSNAPLMKSWFLAYQYPNSYRRNEAPANTLLSMMEKSVAGVAVNNSLSEVVVTGYGTGNAEAAGNLRLRGANSVKSNSPVYVVDGKIVPEQEFKQIDGARVKSVNVLKGTAATSLYGNSAAEGAVVVSLKDQLGDYITVNDNPLNITYEIELPYDVPGNGKEQNVSLKEVPVDTYYNYYAAPALDKDAYLLGEVANWEQLNLLPGEANIIFEGRYIGKTFIDPAATQDSLHMTLGKDKRLVIKKEKLQDVSSVKFLGSNKKQVFMYEITIRNNKKEALQLLLKDQYPLSTNKDIEVQLLESSGATDNTDLGILTWKLALQPGELKKIRVGYSVKYPKDKTINL